MTKKTIWGAIFAALGLGGLLFCDKETLKDLDAAVEKLQKSLNKTPDGPLSDTTVDDILKRGRP